jgi:hypothetical protein
VYVAFGRPRGHRGSYKVWEESGVFPQVIFEVLAPSNTEAEMQTKREFYFNHGAEEYYEFDPEAGTWLGFLLNATTGVPEQIANMDGFISPRLRMRFAFRPLELLVFRPDGSRFLSFQEIVDLAEASQELAQIQRQRADAEYERAETERQLKEDQRRRAETERQRAEIERRLREEERARAEIERQRAETERQRAEIERRLKEEERQRADQQQQETERLRALLRAAGIDPDKPLAPP